jgi:hypothetical protein
MKSYSKSELAQAYAPDISPGAARNRLAVWIRHNTDLYRALLEAGYKPKQQVLTPPTSGTDIPIPRGTVRE